MSVQLTKLQKQLCNALQDGLPICQKPYADLAEFLGSDEKSILQEITRLKEAGIIRRICAIINYHATGLTGTLVAAHIPENSLKGVTETINSMENVSHNYLRKHHYNLWFTLQAKSAEEIKVTLLNLSGRFGADFYSLPIERVFKLDVRFDAEGQGQLNNIRQLPGNKTAELSKTEKQILSKLEDELDLIQEPFDFLCSEGLKIEEILRVLQGLIDKGVIRRIAAIVDHRKLGFAANVMFCCKVSQNKIIEAGEALARFGTVSHCYERNPVENWPYNLYAMMHGKSMGEIQHVINKFTEAENIDSFELLPTEAELKKKPVKNRFD